jgi:hypothetical protein
MSGEKKLSLAKEALEALRKRKQEYEAYFEQRVPTEDKGMDNQALNAYTSLVKTLVELARKVGGPEEDLDPREMRRVAEEIFEREYGIERKRRKKA